MSNQTSPLAANHDVLRVELGARSYDILVGSNLLADTASH
ncbi:MAG TPA: 3-dehydroquinate synthase, partial [Thalassospira sp.]|nr:3-dehydroquinate synthase [Thalassospira sp.]